MVPICNLLPGPGTLKGTSLPASALCGWDESHLRLLTPLATSEQWQSNSDPPTQLLTKPTSTAEGEGPMGAGSGGWGEMHEKEESQSAHPEPQESHRDRRDQVSQKVEVKPVAENTGIFF